MSVILCLLWYFPLQLTPSQIPVMDSFLLLALLAAIAIGAYLLIGRQKPKPTIQPSPSPAAAPKKVAKVDITKKSPNAPSQPATTRKSSDAEGIGDHPLVYRHLRGHQGEITGISLSADGRHLASVAKDEQLRLWTIVDGQPNTHFARVNLKKGDYATAVSLSGPYVTIAIAESRQIHIYGVKEDRKAQTSSLTLLHTFPTPHRANITTLRMTSNQQSIITMAEGSNDLNIHVFSAKGAILATLPVAQLVNYTFGISSDDRFLAVGTKISDTKVYELMYPKSSSKSSSGSSSAPEKVELVMSLKGHKRGVRSVAFGSNGRILTASIDGAFAEHSLQVRYAQREDPKLKYRCVTEFDQLTHIDVTQTENSNEIPLIAVASGPTVQFWRAHDLQSEPTLLTTIHAPHKGNVTHLELNRPNTPDAKRFLVTAGENKSITLFSLPK